MSLTLAVKQSWNAFTWFTQAPASWLPPADVVVDDWLACACSWCTTRGPIIESTARCATALPPPKAIPSAMVLPMPLIIPGCCCCTNAGGGGGGRFTVAGAEKGRLWGRDPPRELFERGMVIKPENPTTTPPNKTPQLRGKTLWTQLWTLPLRLDSYKHGLESPAEHVLQTMSP